jgi:hypothetical protein
MVLGQTPDGPVTLLNCLTERTAIDVEDINVGQCLRGLHLASPDDARFTSTTVRIEYLLGWLGDHSTFGLTIEEENDGWTGQQTVTTKPLDDLVVTCGDFEFTFAVVFDPFKQERHGRANELRMASKEWCELTIASKTALPYSGFEQQVKAITDLLTLTAHAPAGVLRQRLRYKTSDERLLELGVDEETADLFARQIHQPTTRAKETDRVEYLFTLDDVDLADILPKWIELHDRTWLVCGMLFGLRYVPEGYTQSRLMTSVTVAEAMHRELYPKETALPLDKFKKMLKRIRCVLDGDDDDSIAVLKYVEGSLQNRLSCKERLLKLAKIPDQQAVAMLISDVDRWAMDMRDARDGVAHAIQRRFTPEGAGSSYYALQVNIMLVSLVLMEKIGVPGEVQRRAAGSRYLSYIIKEFNRTLPGA